MKALTHTHDLRLPDWGPYTKKYIGISHLADREAGIRFDLSVFPGFYRRKVDVPNVMWESGYHPWEAAPDLSYFCHRHEMEWQDRVYCDISFSKLTVRSRLIRCEFVNATDEEQNAVLHYMASMHFPTVRSNSPEWLRPCRVRLPGGAVWVEALDYEDLQFAVPRPKDSLVTDGFFRGEIRANGFVKGSGVGTGFGRDAGDWVSYRFDVDRAIQDAVVLIRYRMPGGAAVRFATEGAVDAEVRFEGGEGFRTVCVSAGDLTAGRHAFRLRSMGGAAVELDGFAVASGKDVEDVAFEPVVWHPVPKMAGGPSPNSLMLRYPDVKPYYGVRWAHEPSEVREFHTDELDRLMRYTVHQHVHSTFKGQGEGHFANVFIRPIMLAPRSTKVVYGMVCAGEELEVKEALAAFGNDPDAWEQRFRDARAGAVDFAESPAGGDYTFSQKRMAATTLTNVVFPVYTKRTYIRHSAPGRWWDSLYTWDSGFIGLGLLELELDRAVDCLNAYVTEPGDPHAAFIHHGSPVPVQMYLFLEMCNRTQSRDLLAYFYPRLRQYHRFLCGRLGSSTTRRLGSNLLKTWDYFYNSGGWDDYPPQVHVHRNRLEDSVAPVVNTAHAVRTARILRMAAEALGETDDMAEYDGDIATFGEAIQAHAWDEASGYFGYVCHDESGRPTGILRHESGQNYDMGLDGAYPLVAGICTDAQRERLLSHLTSEDRLWSRIGLSTVDQSAAYFRTDGYWNGAVWMPHQWFFWKAMLDQGRADLAFAIADRGLCLWRDEVGRSYNCFEHFIVASGRGAGWHQFGGLSTPVLCWFGAYYRPGRLTCGLDVWVMHLAFSDDNRGLKARLALHGTPGRALSVVASMAPGETYAATWNGETVAITERLDGVLEMDLPCGSEGELVVR